MKFRSCAAPRILLALACALVSACAPSSSQTGVATRQAMSSTGTAARDIAGASTAIVSSTYRGVGNVASTAQTRTQILSMPKTQDGWIEASEATAITPSAQWNVYAIRDWRVRLPSGSIYTIQQAGPQMHEGQKVIVVRYGAKLAIAD